MLQLGLPLSAVLVHRAVAPPQTATVTLTVSCLTTAVGMSLKTAPLKWLGRGHTFLLPQKILLFVSA